MEALAVELANVRRSFGATPALAGIDLGVRRGEFYSLLGPSGCGKTTVLRLIAGLDSPDLGSVRIGGADMTGFPAHRRPVNTVFQSYALFPHLSVHDNIAFGLRMKNVAKPEIADRVRRIMGTVQIADLGDRKPHQLSGGQKQRVALARALVNEPEVLLLDEPLGALDLQLRKQLQAELRSLQRRLGITFIYVTHDQDEAMTMSDRIAVMDVGTIQQVGSAMDIYERPRTRFVAQFLGSCNLIDAIVQEHANGRCCFRTSDGKQELWTDNSQSIPKGSARTLAIRPEKIVLDPSADRERCNGIPARLTAVIYRGAEIQYDFETATGRLHVRRLNVGAESASIQIGHEVTLQLPPSALIVLEN